MSIGYNGVEGGISEYGSEAPDELPDERPSHGHCCGDWRGTNLGVLIMFGGVNAAAQLVHRTHRKHLSRFALTRTGIRLTRQ